MRNFVGVLFFIMSGLIVYMMCLLAFFEMPEMEEGLVVMLAVLCVPLLVFHLIGLAFYRGTSWKTSTSYTLLSGVVVNFFVVISILSIKASPEAAAIMDTSGLDAFSGYLSGSVVMAVFMGLGLILFWLGRSPDKAEKATQ